MVGRPMFAKIRRAARKGSAAGLNNNKHSQQDETKTKGKAKGKPKQDSSQTAAAGCRL